MSDYIGPRILEVCECSEKCHTKKGKSVTEQWYGYGEGQCMRVHVCLSVYIVHECIRVYVYMTVCDFPYF